MNLDNIDWPLLAKQKQWLLKHDCPEADGLINLIDSIQDIAVDDGIASEEAVFPYLTP